MISHKKNPRPLEKNEKNLIELIDPNVDPNNLDEYDVFARYHPKEDYLSTSAFDAGCYWDRAVHLYQDHYEIPGYIMYDNKYEEMKKYREMLDVIFAKDRKEWQDKKQKEIENELSKTINKIYEDAMNL